MGMIGSEVKYTSIYTKLPRIKIDATMGNQSIVVEERPNKNRQMDDV